jgi:ATP-dependent protease ClpP protease subunit
MNRVVYITGEIGDGTAKEFNCMVRELLEDSKEDINIIITTFGGSFDDGLSIIRTIQYTQSQGVRVVGHVYGYAQSMGFLILQHCDERRMGKLDSLMAHGILSDSPGCAVKDKHQETKLLTFWFKELSLVLEARCNKQISASIWKKVLSDGALRYYTANEALKKGLVDFID